MRGRTMVLRVFAIAACVVLSSPTPMNRAAFEEAMLEPEPYTDKTIDQLIMSTYVSMDDVRSASVMNNGTVLAELDMMLTEDQFRNMYRQGDWEAAYPIEDAKRRRRNIRNTRLRWTNGVVPYELSPGSFSTYDQGLIRQAVSEWNAATCLNIRPATYSDRNKIRMQNGQGCNSALGMVGGTQILNLQAPGCRYKGLYLHELGHAIGLVHEHQLPARDDYIYIQYQNVFQGWGIWFNKYKDAEINTHGVDYDLGSVMHYGVTAFSKDGTSKTIRTHDPSKEHLIGRVYEKGLTFADIKIVNLMYNCAAHCRDGKRCIKGGFKDKRCNCVCPPGVTNCVEGGVAPRTTPAPTTSTGGGGGGSGGCTNNHGRCPVWANDGWCTRGCTEWMNENCKKSCNKCTETPPPPQRTTPLLSPPPPQRTTPLLSPPPPPGSTTTTLATPPPPASSTTVAPQPTTDGGETGEDPGCYREGPQRDLPLRAYGDQQNTRERCREACRERNNKYAGVQNGVGCWCGNSYGRYGKAPEEQCSYSCSGNAAQTCGGWFKNYIMKVIPDERINLPGCFRESHDRELYHRAYSDDNNTRDRCKTVCREGGYKYAGVQNGVGCWCGNEAGVHGAAQASECSTPCSGNRDETCGGWYINYVMESGYGS